MQVIKQLLFSGTCKQISLSRATIQLLEHVIKCRVELWFKGITQASLYAWL